VTIFYHKIGLLLDIGGNKMSLLFVYYNPKKWKETNNWEKLKNGNVEVKVGYRPTECYGDEIAKRYFASGDWDNILNGEWWFDVKKISSIASKIVATDGETEYVIDIWWNDRILD
jgi:hypothetical protein